MSAKQNKFEEWMKLNRHLDELQAWRVWNAAWEAAVEVHAEVEAEAEYEKEKRRRDD